MNLWQTFEIGKTKYQNSGIVFRYEKGIDEKLKEIYKKFAKWLRQTYVFPARLTVYVKNCEKVKLLNGDMAYGSFRWFENKNPYIRIPSSIYPKLYEKYSEEELFEGVLSSLVHELTHYFQWVTGLEQEDKVSEKQANFYRYRIIDKFNEGSTLLDEKNCRNQ